jgi:WXG100 family type VII secretion target
MLLLMDLSADHPAFRAAVADVAAAADRLRADRDRVARHVDLLLDGGWSGVAATSYAAGWSDWRDGAERVLDGLVTMGRLLDAVHLDLTERDDGARAGLMRLTARLG